MILQIIKVIYFLSLKLKFHLDINFKIIYNWYINFSYINKKAYKRHLQEVPRIKGSNYLKIKFFLLASVMILIVACQIEGTRSPLVNPEFANLCYDFTWFTDGDPDDPDLTEIKCYDEKRLTVKNYSLISGNPKIAIYYDELDRIRWLLDENGSFDMTFRYEPFDEATNDEPLSFINPAIANTCRIMDQDPSLALCYNGKGLHVKTRLLDSDGSIKSETVHAYNEFNRPTNGLTLKYCAYDSSIERPLYTHYCDHADSVQQKSLMMGQNNATSNAPNLPDTLNTSPLSWTNNKMANVCEEERELDVGRSEVITRTTCYDGFGRKASYQFVRESSADSRKKHWHETSTYDSDHKHLELHRWESPMNSNTTKRYAFFEYYPYDPSDYPPEPTTK